MCSFIDIKSSTESDLLTMYIDNWHSTSSLIVPIDRYSFQKPAETSLFNIVCGDECFQYTDSVAMTDSNVMFPLFVSQYLYMYIFFFLRIIRHFNRFENLIRLSFRQTILSFVQRYKLSHFSAYMYIYIYITSSFAKDT